MPSTATPTAVYDLAAALLACAAAGLETQLGVEGVPDRQCVVWGEIAGDDCRCGELYVAIGRQAPSANFPQEGSGPGATTRCGPPIWMINYSIFVARCVPIQDDLGNPPTCAELDAAAQAAAVDAWAVRNAVSCCLYSLRKDLTASGGTAIHDYQIREQRTVGPEGGCAGSSLNILVGINNCLCVEEAS